MRKFSLVLAAVTAAAITFLAAGTPSVAATAQRSDRPEPSILTHPISAVRPAAVASTGPDLGPLTAMTSALATTGHNIAMTTQASTMDGAVDPTTNAASAVAKGSGLELDEIVSGGKIFMKADLGAINSQVGITPGVWMVLDPGQIGSDNALLIQPDASDPVDLTGIMNGITALRTVDAQHLQGTIDLTRVTGHTMPDPSEVARAGPAATHVPFSVSADANGRISSLKVNAAAFDPGLSLDVAYTDYGTPGSITVPSGPVPAPAGVYSLFNN